MHRCQELKFSKELAVPPAKGVFPAKMAARIRRLKSPLCTTTLAGENGLDWLLPRIGADGSLALEADEIRLARIPAVSIRAHSTLGGAKSDVVWDLGLARPVSNISGTTGGCWLTVTTNRVVWSRRVADNEYACGQARFDWVSHVALDETSRPNLEFGIRVLLKT